MKYFTTILLLTLLITSCKKNIENDNNFEITDENYLIFGSFHGECMGSDCVKIFVLTEDKLYEDPNDLNGTLSNYQTLSNEKYNQVKDLLDYIPNELILEDNQTFGCPDCVDQGGLYVKYEIDGNSGEFRIDSDKSKIPDYLYPFIDKINEKLALL